MPPSNKFTIAANPPTSAKLKPGKEAQFVFTATNLSAPDSSEDVIALALVGDERKEVDWITAAPKGQFKFPGGHTQSITVTAKPPAGTPAGSHKVRLVVANARKPNEDFDESQAIDVEVLAADAPTTTTTKPPWLLIAIIGGVLIVGGIVVGVVMALKKGGGDGVALKGECDPPSKVCKAADGTVCDPERKRCLLPGGDDCKTADECVSNQCSDQDGRCAKEVGATCDPKDNALPCVNGSSCDPAKLKCLVVAGGACKNADLCATGKCEGNVCVAEAPPLKPGDPCTGTCPAPLRCHATEKRCLGSAGFSPCTKDDQCTTKACQGGTCIQLTLLRDCTADGRCAPEHKCVQVQAGQKSCRMKPGGPCNGDGQCSSGWCNGGSCARDDGKCDEPRECPPQYQCALDARHKCLLPNGRSCNADSQCLSDFCNDSTKTCQASVCGQICEPSLTCNHVQRKCVQKPRIKIMQDVYFKAAILEAAPSLIKTPAVDRTLMRKGVVQP